MGLEEVQTLCASISYALPSSEVVAMLWDPLDPTKVGERLAQLLAEAGSAPSWPLLAAAALHLHHSGNASAACNCYLQFLIATPPDMADIGLGSLGGIMLQSPNAASVRLQTFVVDSFLPPRRADPVGARSC